MEAVRGGDVPTTRIPLSRPPAIVAAEAPHADDDTDAAAAAAAHKPPRPVGGGYTTYCARRRARTHAHRALHSRYASQSQSPVVVVVVVIVGHRLKSRSSVVVKVVCRGRQ